MACRRRAARARAHQPSWTPDHLHVQPKIKRPSHAAPRGGDIRRGHSNRHGLRTRAAVGSASASAPITIANNGNHPGGGRHDFTPGTLHRSGFTRRPRARGEPGDPRGGGAGEGSKRSHRSGRRAPGPHANGRRPELSCQRARIFGLHDDEDDRRHPDLPLPGQTVSPDARGL